MKKNIIIFCCLLVLIFTSCRKTEKYYDYFGKITSEIQMKNGVPDGVAKFYFQDGKNINAISNYKNGKLEGGTTRWYYNGLKEYEEFYTNDQLHGTRKAWDKNGNLILEEEYTHGELNGISRTWYSNGQIKIDAYYLDGMPHGNWVFYDSNGIHVGYAEFENGNGTQISLNPNGTISKVIHYEGGIKIDEE
ncbi:MAG: toxin-antitoxin system YwqK family antitoxin [Bacteroidales bacterium]|jgi:antitoxin component YwqK of YwqJK toxin-antitoxin module|nr:toxin-antitoxin system YwqK family antitoxin [Bacteroidales bacterium]